MRFGNLKGIGMLALLFVVATNPGFAQNILYSINPNSEDAPPEIRALELSFRMNQANITAPYILVTADGQRGFVNYIGSGGGVEQGYILVIRPLAEDPGDRIESALPVGSLPVFMTFNPTETQLWLVNLGSFSAQPHDLSHIQIIDVETLATVADINIPGGGLGFGSNIVFSPGGAKAYISSTFTDEVIKIDAVDYQIENRATLEVPDPYYYTSVGPAWLTLSHDGTFLCSTNTTSDAVSIIDADSLAEIHQVILTREDAGSNDHTPNLSYRNNVLLSEDDSIGLVASIGIATQFFAGDRVYLFNPQTGQKLTNDDGSDKTLIVADSPSIIRFDPTGQYLVVQVSSYDQIDTSGLGGYGFPQISIFRWPTLELYKTLQYRRPPYNMSRTTEIAFIENADATFDILFPSFSSYDQVMSNYFYETIVRVPIQEYEPCSIVQIVNESEEREVPVTTATIPGSDRCLVAKFLTSALDVIRPQPNDVLSTAHSVFLEEDRFSSVAFLNLEEDPVTFRMQAIQSDDSFIEEDNPDAGLPFYYINDEDEAVTIDAIDLTLEPGQQLVRMFEGLVPDYDKVESQHGFLKAVNQEYPLRGLVYNGVFGEDGQIIRGDYLRIDQPVFQDAVFPFMSSGGNLQNVLHFSNPYFNQYDIIQSYYDADGELINSQQGTITNTYGRDQRLDLPFRGYMRVFNLANLKTSVYMTYESKFENNLYLFACPPLFPGVQSLTQAYHLPYYVVGDGYDTSVILISFNEKWLLDENGEYVLDENEEPIPLLTHARFDFYDNDGNLVVTKETDFQNTVRYEVYMSSLLTEEEKSRFNKQAQTGSVVIQVDRNFVVGAYTYTEWALIEDPDEPGTFNAKIQNMTVDELPQTEDVVGRLVFPYTISIAPYNTSYVLHNPGDVTVRARLEVFDSDGNQVAVSLSDQEIPPYGNKIFFLGDPDIFGPGAVPENFVGYMRIQSTNGRPFLGKSIQFSPDMLALIPTL
ncbi:MAG: hypothetical protein JXQ27_07105 [Acidobacteria bacterium]|nr:hypothetical protein [Acidobacteriota bacterium]